MQHHDRKRRAYPAEDKEAKAGVTIEVVVWPTGIVVKHRDGHGVQKGSYGANDAVSALAVVDAPLNRRTPPACYNSREVSVSAITDSLGLPRAAAGSCAPVE